jgi:hypothetical protein
VFWGECEFKTPMPDNVMKWIKYPFYVKSKDRILLTDSEVERICALLKPGGTHIPIISNIQNANVIKNQNNNNKFPSPSNKETNNQQGYCLRCGDKMPLNRDRPLCRDCYESWSRWKNPDFAENYCHQCGKKFTTSVKKPVCLECFKSSQALKR